MVYFNNHLFFIHVAALACIQNNNISGLINPKHVRIQYVLPEGVNL